MPTSTRAKRERDEAERMRAGAARLFRIASRQDLTGWDNWRKRLAAQLDLLLVELNGRRIPARHRALVEAAAALRSMVR